jgi:hypothetical protein
VLVVVAVLRWTDSGAHVDRARDDLLDLSAVDAVTERDGEWDVDVEAGTTAEDLDEVLAESGRFAEAVAASGGATYVVVRSGPATVQVGDDRVPVEPALIAAVGAWAAPDGTQVRIGAVEDGVSLRASAPASPSVSTLRWAVDGVAGLERGLAGTIREISSSSDASVVTSRLLAPDHGEVVTSRQALQRLDDLADLDPSVVMLAPHQGVVTVRPAPADVASARARVTRAVSPYDDVEIIVESNG